MTLIVGNKLNNSIFIETDSRVTLPNEEKSYPLDGVLKAWILHPVVCVAFAGIIDHAWKGLKELINFFRDKNTFSTPLNNQDIEGALAILLTKQKESKGSTDFVLATLHKGKPELFKIQNEKIEYDINHFWLGAKEGFEVYQQNFHNPQVTEELLALYKYCPKIIDPTESSLKTRMRSSFKKVIERNLKGTA